MTVVGRQEGLLLVQQHVVVGSDDPHCAPVPIINMLHVASLSHLVLQQSYVVHLLSRGMDVSLQA